MGSTVRPLRTGLVVGLIGYAAVSAFYAAFDILAARGKLFTVNLLGMAVFRGERDPSILMLPVAIDRGAVFLYNGLHFFVSLAIGVVVMWLILQAERHPSRARLITVVVAGGFVVTVMAVGALTAPMRPVLPWWSIVAANGLASAVAASYLLLRYPGLPGWLLPSTKP